MIIKLLLHALAAILGLYLVARYIPGIDFVGELETLLLAGFIMGLINFLIRPILQTVFYPLKFLTLGISCIIINLGLVWLIIGLSFSDYFIITSLWAYLWVFLLVSLLSMILISKK